MAKSMSFRGAALTLLAREGPLHYTRLTELALAEGLVASTSVHSAASMNAVLAMNIKRHGERSPFRRVAPGVFALREQAGRPDAGGADGHRRDEADEADEASDDGEERVRVVWLPTWAQLRAALGTWAGEPRALVLALHRTLIEIRGTPQQQVDWSEPERWIPERLKGDEARLALAIWRESDGLLNPRHTEGTWSAAQRHALLDAEPNGRMVLTARGRAFVDAPRGQVETELDEAEGLLAVLGVIADRGPMRSGAIEGPWGDFLADRSNFRAPATIRTTLRFRILNLLDRGLIERRGHLYSATPLGLERLRRAESGEDGAGSGGASGVVRGSNSLDAIRAQVDAHQRETREALAALLGEMEPYAFEHLVARLLEAMGYEDVAVTSRGNDGGVDVTAKIEVGITSVKEVVQAKRHRRTIQRKDLDALRGSLYRFGAVRGTIVTTAGFSKGTQDAAFEPGAAPITLIDGERLVDLLIEHGIGVRKRPLELLELDPEGLAGEDVEG